MPELEVPCLMSAQNVCLLITLYASGVCLLAETCCPLLAAAFNTN